MRIDFEIKKIGSLWRWRLDFFVGVDLWLSATRRVVHLTVDLRVDALPRKPHPSMRETMMRMMRSK